MRLKTGEVLYEKSDMSPRPPPKISLRHDHDWTRGNVPLGSTVDQQPEGKVVRQSREKVQHATFSQLTQPIPKPICDRSGQPDNTQDMFVVKGETSRSHEINEKGFHKELGSSDRSGKPERLSEDIRVTHAHDGTGHLVEQSLCLLGFCVVPRKGSSTSRIQQSLEEQGCRNPIREKLQRL